MTEEIVTPFLYRRNNGDQLALINRFNLCPIGEDLTEVRQGSLFKHKEGADSKI